MSVEHLRRFRLGRFHRLFRIQRIEDICFIVECHTVHERAQIVTSCVGGIDIRLDHFESRSLGVRFESAVQSADDVDRLLLVVRKEYLRAYGFLFHAERFFRQNIVAEHRAVILHRLHLDVNDFHAHLRVQSQCPARQIVRCPPRHDDDGLAAFFETRQHCIAEPFLMLLLHRLIERLLGILDEVVDYQHTCPEACCRPFWRCRKIRLKSAFKRPHRHRSIALLYSYPGEHIAVNRDIRVTFHLADGIAHTLCKRSR